MKKILVSTIVAIATLQAADKICLESDPSIKVTSEDLKLVSELFPSLKYATDANKEKFVRENRLYTKAFFQNSHMSEKERHKLQMLFESIVARLYLNNLKEKYKPNDLAVKSFYLDHKENFRPSNEFETHVIITDSLKKANDAYYALVEKKEPFEKVAKKYSDDPSASVGGKFPKTPANAYVPPLREWLNHAKEGEISRPIKIGNRYFVVRLDRKIKVDASYERLSPEIRKILQGAMLTQKINEETRRLEKLYKVSDE